MRSWVLTWRVKNWRLDLGSGRSESCKRLWNNEETWALIYHLSSSCIPLVLRWYPNGDIHFLLLLSLLVPHKTGTVKQNQSKSSLKQFTRLEFKSSSIITDVFMSMALGQTESSIFWNFNETWHYLRVVDQPLTVWKKENFLLPDQHSSE